jgi:AraC-like DNA-binding protein
MKRIDPKIFSGPRSYFTAFDPRIVARVTDLVTFRKEVERKLKILLLIKSTITCGASHLTTAFTYSIFRDNPYLLNEGHIIPALSNDKKNIDELFESKKIKDRKKIVEFYQENIKYTVDWEISDNSSWFRDRFIAEFENRDSLMRKHLSSLKSKRLEDTIKSIRAKKTLSRTQIDSIADQLPAIERNVLLAFRELVYHISGARVVNCESSLPQENYIDFDLADLEHKRTRLSEDQILWKLFIELAFESFQNRYIPIELLDMLSFRDILTIRQPILESSFQQKYDELVSSVIQGVKSKNKSMILNANELHKISSHLEQTFKSVFDDEMPKFLKKRATAQAKKLGSVTSSVALGALGFIPGLSAIAGASSILKDTPALLVNVGQMYSSAKSLVKSEEYFLNKERILKKQIENIDISEKSELLDMVDMFSALISHRTRI